LRKIFPAGDVWVSNDKHGVVHDKVVLQRRKVYQQAKQGEEK
jgi:hypothetical protein